MGEEESKYTEQQNYRGYRPPNIKKFLEELPERVESIRKFEKFTYEKMLKPVSQEALERRMDF